mmetsp:Transcript_5788/g.9519  ORF Transcript_5788/g.9519 Transcript_5788/m.9519 type:complete len:218 (-) Transcript_5788:745-1398(-)
MSSQAVTEFYRFEKYGFGRALDQSSSKEGRAALLKIICGACNGDGEFSALEKLYVKGHFMCMGAQEEPVDRIITSTEKLSIESLVAKLNIHNILESSEAKKIIVYVSLCAAAADGLDDEEIKYVSDFALAAGLSEDAMNQIKDVVNEEFTLKMKRMKTMGMAGHSCLHPMYSAMLGAPKESRWKQLRPTRRKLPPTTASSYTAGTRELAISSALRPS